MARGGEARAEGKSRPSWLTTPLHVTVTAEGLTWAAVAIGVALRLLAYAENRPLYRDERSLLENLVALPVFDFHTTLTEYQLAPPGFLAIERMLVRLPLPGREVLAARSFPLVCGLASIFLFRAAARRFLTPHAVPIAMGLFALSDWLIYYSAEMKQYSCDLALTLAALLLAVGPMRRMSSEATEETEASGVATLSPRRLLCIAGFGAVGIWFSYPLVFVLAGVGTYLVAPAAIRRDGRGILSLVAVGVAWASSFAACYLVSHGMLDKGRFIWDWWDFAFLRVPPHSLAELKLEFWQLLNVFDSPADVKTPLGPVFTAILALVLAIAGATSMLRRRPGGLYLLTAPLAFVLAASVLRQYPFHGRLLIFLVPSVQMLVSQGAAVISRPGGAGLAGALGAFLLLQPAGDALSHRLVRPLNHDNFDSHGDLRPDLLDYLGVERMDTGRTKR
jgi:hypothetical protein